MKRITLIGAISAGAAVALVAATTAFAEAGQAQGPSSSTSPYLVRTTPGIVTMSILTTGDSVDGYRMAGIPDGLGAYDNGDGTFTVLMNHELSSNVGVVRAHGGKGAFVSKWIIEKDGLKARHGEDLIKRILQWNGATAQWQLIPAGSPLLSLGRLCSADLPQGALYDAATGLGTQEQIFMDGEENGSEGRPFGTVVTGPDAGSAYHLSSLGRMSFENTLAKSDTGARTVVAELEDTGNGQVYFYVGTKKDSGTDVDKAGLTGGALYGLKIDGMASESDATTLPDGSARFSLVPLGDVAQLTGAQLDMLSRNSGVSGWNRPEDGSRDPSDAQNFYFKGMAVSLVPTGGFAGVHDQAAIGTDGSWTVTDRAGSQRAGRLTDEQRGTLSRLAADPRLVREATRTQGPSKCADVYNYVLMVNAVRVSFIDCPTDADLPPAASAIIALVTRAVWG